MPGRVCRHYSGSPTTRAEGTDRHMEPDREDRSAGPACLRDARLRETQLRDEWRRQSLASGWRMPDDWDSEAVDEVLAACQNRALARGEAGLAAAGATALAAAFPGGETLSLAKPGPAIALVPARGDLPLRYARLRRNIQAAFGTQIRITPLPGQLTEALRLVDELAR